MLFHLFLCLGIEKGGTTFNGSEGIIVDTNNLNQSEIYFTCKSGGFAGLGQIWRYNPANDYITLFYESKSKDEFWMGDNITISPRRYSNIISHPEFIFRLRFIK